MLYIINTQKGHFKPSIFTDLVYEMSHFLLE